MDAANSGSWVAAVKHPQRNNSLLGNVTFIIHIVISYSNLRFSIFSFQLYLNVLNVCKCHLNKYIINKSREQSLNPTLNGI